VSSLPVLTTRYKSFVMIPAGLPASSQHEFRFWLPITSFWLLVLVSKPESNEKLTGHKT